ncbi:MAG: phospholipase D-like domain-containing protein [Bacillota bacterium]
MNKKITSFLLAIVIALSFSGCDQQPGVNNPNTQTQQPNVNQLQLSQELVVMPQDGKLPLINLINSAKQSVDIVVYELEDDSKDKAANIAEALVAAKKRGVSVRVIINGFNKANSYEKWAKVFLDSNRIDYRVATKKFVYTHQKTTIIDNNKAFIGTFNYVDTKKTSYFSGTRDFAIITAEADEVKDVVAVFEADWKNAADQTRITPELTAQSLVFSPVNAREKLSALIKSARKTLYSYQQEMGDLNSRNEGLCRDIADAGDRGVDVRVICSDMDGNLREIEYLRKHQVKVEVVTASKQNLYIHAKVYIVDGTIAELGSINMTTNSIEHNRELGIISVNPKIVAQLTEIFMADWKKYE